MNDKDLKPTDNLEETPQTDIVETPEIISDSPVDSETLAKDEAPVEVTREVIEKPASSSEEIVEATEAKEEGTVEKEVKADDSKEEKTKVKSIKDLKGKWYIVHTYSGHENKVGKTLMQRVQSMGYEDRIFDAIVPTRETIRIRAGKKEKIKEKIFPGYIFVNMDLTDESWILVRTTPGVTSFVGAENKPTPISDAEVAAIIEFVDRKEPVYKAQFSVGEAVKINDGPFLDFLGTVESIDQEKGKIKVLVSIFGRETPVELDFLQVTKI